MYVKMCVKVCVSVRMSVCECVDVSVVGTFCHNLKIKPLQKHPFSRHRCTNAPGMLGTPLALHSARTTLPSFRLIDGVQLIYYNLA